MADLGLGCIVGPFFAAEDNHVFRLFNGETLGYDGTLPTPHALPAEGTPYQTVEEFEADFYGTKADGEETGLVLKYADGLLSDPNAPAGTPVLWFTETSMPNNTPAVGFINDWYNYWGTAIGSVQDALELFDGLWTDQLGLPAHDGYAMVLCPQSMGWIGRNSIDPDAGDVAYSFGGMNTLAFTTTGGGGTQIDDDDPDHPLNWDGGNVLQVIYLYQGGPPGPGGSISADPNPIMTGDNTTLTWSTSMITNASISGIGDITPASGGSVVVSPSVTTLYTLFGDGFTLDSVTVFVNEPPPPAPTAEGEGVPGAIYIGQTTSVEWTSENATSATMDHGVGSVPVNGSHSVSPTETTTYTITFTGPGGTFELPITVTILPFPQYRAFFAELRDPNMQDWEVSNGTSYNSFFETSQNLQDLSTKGNTPYIYTFMTNDVDAEQAATITVKWDWNQTGVRVTAPDEVYRELSGRLVSVRKSRIRGKGRALNIRYDSVGEADFNIKGWVIFYETNSGQ